MLVFGVLDMAHPGRKPSGWRCYACAEPEQKRAYLQDVRKLFDQLPEFATQMRIAVMLREEADKSSFEARETLVKPTWPEPRSEEGKRQQAERQAIEREGFEAALDMATNARRWDSKVLKAHNDAILKYNKENPDKRPRPLKDFPDLGSFPAIQYHVDGAPDGPTGAPPGHVRCYVTVGSPHRDTKSPFKDVWTENGRLLIHGGAKSSPKDTVDKTFWVSMGMPHRQVYYFYKYFRDGAPEPVIRSFTIPEKVWMDSIAKHAVTEENKKFQPTRSALSVDHNRAANQFGVEEAGVAAIVAHADPSSMITIGRPSVASKLDPAKDGKFYTIEEFEDVLGVPHEQLALPDGGTHSFDADGKGALKSPEVARLELEKNRTLQTIDFWSRVGRGEALREALNKALDAVEPLTLVGHKEETPDERSQEEKLALWIVQLLEANHLTPCVSIPNPDYDSYGNREELALEETLFAYYVLTNPEIWRDGLKAIGAALRDAVQGRLAQQKKKKPDTKLLDGAQPYLRSYSDAPVSSSNWQDRMIEAERRLDDPSLHPDEHIMTASFLFYLYRPLFRSLGKGAVEMDVAVNTRRTDVLKIVPASMSPARAPFGLLPHSAPDAVKVFPPPTGNARSTS